MIAYHADVLLEILHKYKPLYCCLCESGYEGKLWVNQVGNHSKKNPPNVPFSVCSNSLWRCNMSQPPLAALQERLSLWEARLGTLQSFCDRDRETLLKKTSPLRALTNMSASASSPMRATPASPISSHRTAKSSDSGALNKIVVGMTSRMLQLSEAQARSAVVATEQTSPPTTENNDPTLSSRSFQLRAPTVRGVDLSPAPAAAVVLMTPSSPTASDFTRQAQPVFDGLSPMSSIQTSSRIRDGFTPDVAQSSSHRPATHTTVTSRSPIAHQVPTRRMTPDTRIPALRHASHTLKEFVPLTVESQESLAIIGTESSGNLIAAAAPTPPSASLKQPLLPTAWSCVSPFPLPEIAEAAIPAYFLGAVHKFGSAPAVLHTGAGSPLTYKRLTTLVRLGAAGLAREGFCKVFLLSI